MKKLISILEILMNLTMIPLFFIRFFSDMAYSVGLDSSNTLSAIITRRSFNIIENLDTLDMLYTIPVAIFIIICSIVLSVLSVVIKDNENLTFTSHVAFGVSVVMFLLLLWFASVPNRAII